MYFDQYMSIYNHFTVLGAKMKVTFSSYDTNVVPLSVGLWQNDDLSITPTTFQGQVESSKGKQAVIGTGGDSKAVLELRWSAKDTFGRSPLSDTSLRGDALANPTETSVGVIAIQAGDRVTSTQCIATIEMEFISCFFELKDLISS